MDSKDGAEGVSGYDGTWLIWVAGEWSGTDRVNGESGHSGGVNGDANGADGVNGETGIVGLMVTMGKGASVYAGEA